jgi:hypothetical protein
MQSKEVVAPSPEVQHLPTLFRKIESGDIRIPAFQRRFVWSEAQILKLLESVYKGYPIGSLLLWRVNESVLKVSDDSSIPFPRVPPQYPLSFVLDGMQRLSTLYGVVYWPRADQEHEFNVVFDLKDEEFRHFRTGESGPYCLPISVLSSPRRLIDAQKELSSLESGDLYIDKTVQLQSVFQEYMIPTVSITRRDVADVVEIFERINNSGTSLSAVDFMRALTWSGHFDLNVELARVHEGLNETGFALEDETLVKLIAVLLGIAPTPHEMLELRNRSPQALQGAVAQTREVLGRIIEFLGKEFSIYSSEFVPYEGQLLVLAKVFSLQYPASAVVAKAVREWFWSISFSEGLRGKPDHYVARAITSAERLVEGDTDALTRRLTLTFEDLLERRFIKGGALSAALSSMFAVHRARSLVTGEVIDPAYYMRELGSENFESLYPLSVVQAATSGNVRSPRVLANLILVSESDRVHLQGLSSKEIIERLVATHGAEANSIAASQFLPSLETFQADDIDFDVTLRRRALSMSDYAATLAGQEPPSRR